MNINSGSIWKPVYKCVQTSALEPWQLNSNIIDEHISDITLRRTVDKLSAVSIHSNLTEPDLIETLIRFCRLFDFFLVSNRGKSADGSIAARENLQLLALDKVGFKDIIFSSSSENKSKIISQIGFDFFIDDSIDILESIDLSIRILYDQFGLFSDLTHCRVVKKLSVFFESLL